MGSKKRGTYINTELLKAVLTAQGITISKMASDLGYNRKSLTRAINVGYMDNMTLEDIAGYLDTDPEHIKGNPKPKRYWADTYTYQRIMEILDDYWLTVEDEQKVEIKMRFERANGETQVKRLVWVNQNTEEQC